jgi:hypothetical protein
LSVMNRVRPASVAADVRPPDTGRPAGLGMYAAARHGLRAGRIRGSTCGRGGSASIHASTSGHSRSAPGPA